MNIAAVAGRFLKHLASPGKFIAENVVFRNGRGLITLGDPRPGVLTQSEIDFLKKRGVIRQDYDGPARQTPRRWWELRLD